MAVHASQEYMPAPLPNASTNEWNRRMNVWDDVALLQTLDQIDPPPPFTPDAADTRRDTISDATQATVPVPSSPPPAFESDDDSEPETTEDNPDDHDASPATEAMEVFDPVVLRERDAWERDRLLGYTLEERVQRMERRKQARQVSDASTAHMRHRLHHPPRDPSTTLEVVTAPLPQFQDARSPQERVNDSSSEDERPRPDDEDSDDEWESEHNALESLYQYEADMRRTLSNATVHAHYNSRHIPVLPTPSTSTRREQEVEAPVPGSFAPEPAAASPRLVAIQAHESPGNERADPHEAAQAPVPPPANMPVRPLPESVQERPLPPPPPSRVALIRAAYDRLHELRRDQRMPHPFDSDIAALENYLSQYEPLQDGTERTDHRLSHFGGAFTNPRSSGAPRPTQAYLPAITDDTRHFPPSASGAAVAAPPLPPRPRPSVHASTSAAPADEPGPAVAAPMPPVSLAVDAVSDSHAALPSPQPSSPAMIPVPALSNPFLQSSNFESYDSAAEVASTSESHTTRHEATEASADQAHERTALDEDITDLDFAVAHLDDPVMQYEWAALISDYLGPAREQANLSMQELQNISVGRVEVVSRRVTSAGRVRVRLSVAGIRVERCSICLEQFKGGQQACILPCLHMYVWAPSLAASTIDVRSISYDTHICARFVAKM